MKNRLQEIREMRGLTQAELAKKAGTTNVQISRMESDDPEKNRGIREYMAVKCAVALQVQPGDLLPIITDGSVPLPTGIKSHEKAVLRATLAKFLLMHTDYEKDACERLSMAAVKYFLMALDDLPVRPAFDLQETSGKLRFDQNIPSNEGN